MTKVFVMTTCPDCDSIKSQLESNKEFEIIDISTHVSNLKQFLALRDSDIRFRAARESGSVGIPCFVTKGGDISFDPKEFGINADGNTTAEGRACSLDGGGC